MLAGMLVVVAVLTVRARFNDPDMWWHLKTGEIIWNTHRIPTVDLFSYTTNHHAWTAHEWLSQLTIYAAYHFGGYTGLMLWLCVFASAFLVAQYVLCSLYSGNAKVALLGGFVAWMFSTIGLAIRPQLIGYLLLTLELLIVHLARTRSPRWFWCLPPLFAVWVNCHGSFFFGLAVLGVFLFCSFLDFRMGLIASCRRSLRERKILAISFALSMAALFVNPVGWKQVYYPLDVMLHLHLNLKFVDEWRPASLGDPRSLAMLGIVGFVLIWALVRRSELIFEELLLVGLGFGLAVQHERMLFVFGILTAPVLCRLLKNSWDGYDFRRDHGFPNLAMLTLATLGIIWAFPSRHDLQLQVEKGSPVKAVEFIQRAGVSGRMLNEYIYGGYLIWAAPQHPVFVDGRGDVFEQTGVLGDFLDWATLRADPKMLLNKYQIDFCLLSRNAPMTRVLPLLPYWKIIYSDEMSVVFARSRIEN
jgi:hypothetical protein